MQAMQKELEDKEAKYNHVLELLSNHYIHNYNPKSFLQKHHYSIPLHEFDCFTYGNINHCRTLYHIQLRAFFRDKGRICFLVYLSYRDEEVWVRDSQCLRKHFFCFEDFTSFFRSTFLYDSTEKTIFRLHRLLPFLQLVNYCPAYGTKIYQSPEVFHVFVHPNETVRITFLIPQVKNIRKLHKKWKEFLDYLPSVLHSDQKKIIHAYVIDLINKI